MSASIYNDLSRQELIKLLTERDQQGHASSQVLSANIQNSHPTSEKQYANVKLLSKALRGYAKSYSVDIDRLSDAADTASRESVIEQLGNTKTDVEEVILEHLASMKGIKLIITLKETFEKDNIFNFSK